jgi:hypothetical protein
LLDLKTGISTWWIGQYHGQYKILKNRKYQAYLFSCVMISFTVNISVYLNSIKNCSEMFVRYEEMEIALKIELGSTLLQNDNLSGLVCFKR